MIRVAPGAAPPFVRDPEFIEARRRFEQFGSAGGTRTTQATLTVSEALGSFQRQAAAYVGELFRGKCAYSEVLTSPLLHLHRPEADAAGDDGVSAPHYWWTAMWHGNWYAASS